MKNPRMLTVFELSPLAQEIYKRKQSKNETEIYNEFKNLGYLPFVIYLAMCEIKLNANP